MKAVLCTRVGAPNEMEVANVPPLQPEQDQVVISVHACGVNFPDLLLVQGKYQHKPPLPFSPGGEVAGIVARVGPGVTRCRPGDRVIAFCYTGGFAEEVVCAENKVSPLPEGMDFITASAFALAYTTSMYALKNRANLRAGETLLVLGAAGGVGLAAVQIGKASGARVIAAASSRDKLEACRESGADELIDYSKEDLRKAVQRITAGKGCDVIYDPVGGKYTEPALRCLAWYGRHLVVGFAAGPVPKVPANLLLLKQASLVGVFMGAWTEREPKGAAELLAELVEMYRDGKVRPVVSQVFQLEEAYRALEQLENRQALGKLVVVTRAGDSSVTPVARL